MKKLWNRAYMAAILLTTTALLLSCANQAGSSAHKMASVIASQAQIPSTSSVSLAPVSIELFLHRFRRHDRIARSTGQLDTEQFCLDSHLSQLSAVDKSSCDGGDESKSVQPDSVSFGLLEFARKFGSYGLFCLGGIVGVLANFALFSTEIRWNIVMRVSVGLAGWGIACILIFHSLYL